MNKEHLKTDPIKTILIIAVGFIIVYLFTSWNWAIFVALIVGLIGIFSTYLSDKINWFWMKLAWILSLIVPNVLLSIIFYLMLFPIAICARFFGKKDPFILKNRNNSIFVERHQQIDKKSFEKPW